MEKTRGMRWVQGVEGMEKMKENKITEENGGS